MFLIILIFVSSCLPNLYPIPQGVWRSEEPSIVLHLGTEFNLGSYMHNDAEIEIHALFHGVSPILEIYDWGMVQELRVYEPQALLMSGTFEVIDDRMYYMLDFDSQQKIGLEKIIFHRSEK